MNNNVQIFVAAIVLSAALGSAIWNALVKTELKPLVFVTLMVLPQIFIALPIALLNFPTSHFIFLLIILSSFVHTIYILLLGKAYFRAKLSLVYPLAAGLAPLLTFSAAHYIYKQQLSLFEIIGICIICLGVLGFSLWNKQFWREVTLPTKLNIFMIAIFITMYSLIDSYGVIVSGNIVSYISWLFVIKGLMLFIPMFYFKQVTLEKIKNNYRSYLIAGTLAGISYTVAVIGFYYTITSYVLSLRAASVIFTVLIAKIFLKERVENYKIVLSFIITFGITVILVT